MLQLYFVCHAAVLSYGNQSKPIDKIYFVSTRFVGNVLYPPSEIVVLNIIYDNTKYTY